MAEREDAASGDGRDVAWMKALRLYGARDLRLEEVERPERTKDEVLLEVKASGISMSDVSVMSSRGASSRRRMSLLLAAQRRRIRCSFAGAAWRVLTAGRATAARCSSTARSVRAVWPSSWR